MVDTRISELPAAGAADGTEQVPVVQGATTRRGAPVALLAGQTVPGQFGVRDAPTTASGVIRKAELDGLPDNLRSRTRDFTVGGPVQSDNNRVLRYSAAGALTVAAGALAEGTVVAFRQVGAGALTFSGTVNLNGHTRTAGQHALVTLTYEGGVVYLAGQTAP